MVARIKIKDALSDNFYYNENKVKEGIATCLAAENYPRELENLSQASRFKMLGKLASLNERIKANSVHVSLNFDPSEKLSDERLKEIAAAYMERLGFGEQPYLVYRHFDAGHPHIHILSVKVGFDGKGIDTHNIGIRKSEPARKELEMIYKLVRAEDMSRKPYQQKSAFAEKVIYGKVESRKAIGAVLESVLTSYNYTTIPELNAVLGLYNVKADRCREGSRVYQNGGLLYRILDQKGEPVGVPIKASSFYNKPGLNYLGALFLSNAAKRQPLKSRIKNAVDLHFIKYPQASLNDLVKALEKEGIQTLLRQSEAGQTYGITYIDHRVKAVFNGSDLGKAYSAKALLERCAHGPNQPSLSWVKQSVQKEPMESQITGDPGARKSDESLLETLLQAEDAYQGVPFAFRKSKKKKRRNRLSGNQ